VVTYTSRFQSKIRHAVLINPTSDTHLACTIRLDLITQIIYGKTSESHLLPLSYNTSCTNTVLTILYVLPQGERIKFHTHTQQANLYFRKGEG